MAANLIACLSTASHKNESLQDLADDILPKALKVYLESFDAYDALLDDFIPKEIREQARRQLRRKAYAEGTNVTALDDWREWSSHLQTRRRQELLGVSTGIPSLDRAIGGLRGLGFLGGGPGAGKTSLALAIALAALRKHPELAVLFYSLDMAKTVIYDRIACQEMGLDYNTFLSGPIPEPRLKLMLEAEAKLKQDILPRLRIMERVPWKTKEGSVLHAMIQAERELLASAEVQRTLTVIDYFQLLPVEEKSGSPQDGDFLRVKLLQELQERTRNADQPMGDPILVISEVRKGETGRTELGIADLMGSSRLGYAAEAILLMESETVDKAENAIPVTLRIAKGRDGAARTQVQLLFEHTCYRFREAPPRRSSKTGKSAKDAKKPAQEKIDPFAGSEDS